VHAICTSSQQAPHRAAQGERTVRTDAMTGVQALERKHLDLPMAPGKVRRRECASIRHGACTFIVRRDVVSGQMIAPSAGPTRTEADVLAHVQGVVACDPMAQRWHFVVDYRDTHRSERLVRSLCANMR
jgi:putative transposase